MNTHPPAAAPVAGPVRPTSLRPSAGPPPARRRLVGALLCGLVALLAALGAAWSVNQVSDRVPVVAVKADVPVGQQISAQDLTVAEIADDPALEPVPAAGLKQLIGQYAAADLSAGSLLTADQVTGSNPLTGDKQMVGVQAKPGRLPLHALQPGNKVLVVATPAEGAGGSTDGSGEEAPVPATVVEVGPPDASGTVVVNLAAAAADAPAIAARAASGNVALVLQARS